MGKTGKTILTILILFVVFFGIRGCSIYNKLVKLDEEVKAQWGNVQTQYQRRVDLIANLVETVKGSAGFESKTLTNVIEARAKATSVTVDAKDLTQENMSAFQEAQSQMSSSLSRLLVAIERYPELKTTEQFEGLRAQLEGIENRISLERRKFNELVAPYNKYVRKFPQIIFARLFGFQTMGYFESDSGAEKTTEVDFGDLK